MQEARLRLDCMVHEALPWLMQKRQELHIVLSGSVNLQHPASAALCRAACCVLQQHGALM